MVKLEVKIEGVTQEFTMPNSWEEMTIGKYISLYNIIEELKEESEFTQIKAIMANLLGADVSLMGKMTISQFNQIKSNLGFIYDHSSLKSTTKKKIEFEGKTLILRNNYNELTVDEVADIQNIGSNQDMANVFKIIPYLVKELKPSGVLGDISFDYKLLPVTEFYSLCLGFTNGKVA